MNHTPEDDVYRFGFTHVPLSTTSAVAPAVSLASAPQATFEVTTLDDVVDAGDGVLSLREAIQLANDRPGLDTITFAEELRGGTIVLEPSTLAITDDLVIDGDSLNRGAGGITIDAGSELWGGPYSASGPMLGLRGDPKSFITVTLEDVSLNGSSAISTFTTLEALPAVPRTSTWFALPLPTSLMAISASQLKARYLWWKARSIAWTDLRKERASAQILRSRWWTAT